MPLMATSFVNDVIKQPRNKQKQQIYKQSKTQKDYVMYLVLQLFLGLTKPYKSLQVAL